MTEWTLRQTEAGTSEWARLLAANEHLLFHEPVWALVTEEGFAGQARCLLFEADGRVVGGMLGFSHRVLWGRFLAFSFPYGGVIGETPPDDRLVALLRRFARRDGAVRLRLVNGPGAADLPRTGFRVTDGSTRVLDLGGRSWERIFADFRKNVRRDVRRAERQGVAVEASGRSEDVDTFYHLYLASMRRNRALAKYPRRLVGAVFRHVVAADRGVLLLARLEGRPVAGILVVDSARMSHYLLGGALPEALPHCPNELLLSTAIRRAVDRGLAAFDFLPSGTDNPGLSRFKAKWNGMARPAPTLDLVVKPFEQGIIDRLLRWSAWPPARAILQRWQSRA